jgi:hypothetical protein
MAIAFVHQYLKAAEATNRDRSATSAAARS